MTKYLSYRFQSKSACVDSCLLPPAKVPSSASAAAPVAQTYFKNFDEVVTGDVASHPYQPI
jgi:hypothetical protein